MPFDKAFAIDKLNEMIAQHPDVAADCGDAEIENYLDCAPFARGMMRYCDLDRDTFVKGLICFDYEWEQQFRQLYRRYPTSNDWAAAFFDRANAFADALGALKPYPNPKYHLRSEYGDSF
jgi:hypothetical protein